MKKASVMLIVLHIGAASLSAQVLNWTDVTQNYQLAEGVRLYAGQSVQPMLNAWHLEVDMNTASVGIRPYLTDSPEGVADFCRRVGAIAAINGGYFGGASSYSAVVYPGEVKAQNIAAVGRSGLTYPVTRSFFGVNQEKIMSVNWIYHFGAELSDLHTFETPTQNAVGRPAPVPAKTDGKSFSDLWVGIGGGPTLLKRGEIHITYHEEVFWDSGIGDMQTLNPRSAVGHTADNRTILLVVDGRQAASQGVDLTTLAQIMKDLGCIEAMNLDGGGSTQLAVGSMLINRPEGGMSMRPVPSILAVVYADSIALPPKDESYERIIDTGDALCDLVGDGWFSSANAGYWGDTPSMLHAKGAGDACARFACDLPPATYELHAWWVAALNRCVDTPIIIRHHHGSDTVRVDQRMHHAQWNRIGAYDFSGDPENEAVIISDFARTGTYIVADAVRFVSYDSNLIAIDRPEQVPPADGIRLYQNYPNPFNAGTEIFFTLDRSSHVRLTVYNLLGRVVDRLLDEPRDAGRHRFTYDANRLSSGIYFYRIDTSSGSFMKKMVLLR